MFYEVEKYPGLTKTITIFAWKEYHALAWQWAICQCCWPSIKQTHSRGNYGRPGLHDLYFEGSVVRRFDSPKVCEVGVRLIGPTYRPTFASHCLFEVNYSAIG